MGGAVRSFRRGSCVGRWGWSVVGGDLSSSGARHTPHNSRCFRDSRRCCAMLVRNEFSETLRSPSPSHRAASAGGACPGRLDSYSLLSGCGLINATSREIGVFQSKTLSELVPCTDQTTGIRRTVSKIRQVGTNRLVIPQSALQRDRNTQSQISFERHK